MSKKILQLELTTEQAGMLAEAVSTYACAAYPLGGSECAQVARETLLDTAKNFVTPVGGKVNVPKRQRQMIRAAIKWYFSDDGPGPSEQQDVFLALLEKNRRSF